MVKVGILGGTFNPIHWGHLLAAETALTQGLLDRVVWIPASYSPYKQTTQPVSFYHRVQMVRLAIASYPQFVLPPFVLANMLAEASASVSPYAIDTFRTLQQHYGTCDWFWIVGFDAFQSLPRWVGRRELISQCVWLVVPRVYRRLDQLHSTTSFSQQSFFQESCCAASMSSELFDSMQSRCQTVAAQLQTEAIAIRWQLLSMPLVQVSSSLVRQYCQQQRSIRYLVPDAVREYIATHRLYQVHKGSQTE